ncbi:unnamed protein product [Closterium sp. NIES-54]
MAWVNQEYTTFGTKVKHLHSDGGGEFCNTKLEAFCSSLGTLQNFTLPDSPQQNGIAESLNHTLVQITRCLLSHFHAPLSLWGTPSTMPPSSTICIPTRISPTPLPPCSGSGKHPMLVPFTSGGAPPMSSSTPRLGGGKVANLVPKLKLRSRDVVFDETRPFYSTPGGGDPFSEPSLVWADFEAPPELPPTSAPSPPTSPAIAPSPFEVFDPTSPVSSAAVPPSSLSTTMPSAPSLPSAPITYHRRSNPPAPHLPPLSHIFPDVTKSPSLNFSENPTIPIPLTVQEALLGPHAAEWRAAMEAECEAFTRNHSFDDETPPPGVHIVGGKWLFRIKQLPEEAPVFKVRYVVKVFTQQQYFDFFKTFSPTSKPPTVRTLLDAAARENFEIKYMDASTAFLPGHLKETVFMD